MGRQIIIWAALAIILATLACGPSPTDEPVSIPSDTPRPTATDTLQPTATNTQAPTPTRTTEPFVGSDCDPETERVEMNTSLTFSVQGGTYPDTCEVFCLWVPDGSRLEIGIRDFDVDLDIYVDIDLSVLQFEDHGRWESNAYGTGDEQVTINNPGGRYYMQVCSYEGLPSSFELHNTFTP